VEASREVGPEVNTEKTKYMVMSCHQNEAKNHNSLTDTKSFKTVTHFKYLGTAVTNEDWIHEEIKSKFNMGNIYYHSVHNLLSSRLLS
jgi:hypothetical protein